MLQHDPEPAVVAHELREITAIANIGIIEYCISFFISIYFSLLMV
jgi:hypothetical protein